MLADFEQVLGRLNVVSHNGGKALCYCPAHEDRNNPSLSLKAENDKLLLHCFAGCRSEDIVSEIGLKMNDLFVEGGGGFSIPRTRLHACTLRAKSRMAVSITGVQAVIHASSTAARSQTTPTRRNCQRTSCKAWA